jgi:hypothetical protein
MDPSVQFLLGNGVAVPEGATIHSLAPALPESIDDDKIGFTLDVAMRLDRELAEDDAGQTSVVPIVEAPPELADSA